MSSSSSWSFNATTQEHLAQHFRSLHTNNHHTHAHAHDNDSPCPTCSGPLILTNVYDSSTTHIAVSHPLTRAIATASYAIAASTYGVEDDDLTPTQNLASISSIANTIHNHPSTHNGHGHGPSIPLSVDIQDGYGTELSRVVEEVIKLGAVGVNLEDTNNSHHHHRSPNANANANGRLLTTSEAVERIKTVMTVAKGLGVPSFVVNARTDILGEKEGASVDDAIERGKAFLDAGACTVFVWGGPRGRGLRDHEVKRLVEGLEGRVSVKMNLGPGYLGVKELREMGVSRVSVGPELWKVAMRAFEREVDRILKE